MTCGNAFVEAEALDTQYVMHTFGDRKRALFVEGEGMVLRDADGKEYLDFLSGIGVVSVGHSHPALVAAVQGQAARLMHVSNHFHIEHRGPLAERLCGLLSQGNGDSWKVFFSNTGAESNEGAMKLARRYGRLHLDGAGGIITAKKSFHGRTLATLAATGQDAKQDPFAPLPAGFLHVEFNDIAALEAAVNSEIDGMAPVAVMLECIQGEAGVWPCTPEYLAAARALTAERGMLLIVDEVQTGMFRCGQPFAFQHFGITPDVVTMAKGIGGGFPMGAFAARGELADILAPGQHGSTFGGGPLACAASMAVLDVLCADGFAAHVQEMGEYLRGQLATLPFVTEVRGAGLMCGASLEAEVAPKMVEAGLEAGFVLNAPAANILRFLPPLVVEKTHINALIDALPAIYAQVQ